ncbi:MAG: phosphoribosyltransferase family protein [Ardenticatenia bacterium]|nr:phosphoribosyltransferase family protein [Ardenticatenia bacterium]
MNTAHTHVLFDRAHVFADRVEAGRLLVEALRPFSFHQPVVVGIPRGGLVVAAEIARLLSADLDFIMPKKLGAPGNTELAIGAITERGHLVLNEDVILYLGVPEAYIEEEARRTQEEIAARTRHYRAVLPHTPFHGHTVILVDDGVATGSTMQAAIAATRSERPAQVVLALPVAPRETFEELAQLADVTVAVTAPHDFWGGRCGGLLSRFSAGGR